MVLLDVRMDAKSHPLSYKILRSSGMREWNDISRMGGSSKGSHPFASLPPSLDLPLLSLSLLLRWHPNGLSLVLF